MVLSTLLGGAATVLGNSCRSEDWEKVDTSSKRSDESATMTPEESQKAALHEKNQRLLHQVAALQDVSSDSSDAHNYAGTIDAKAELEAINKMILELKSNLVTMNINDPADASAPQANAAAHKLKQMKEKVNSVQKGLDICFLVDCTGSMGWCIEQVKSKVRSIINEIRITHKDAIVNVAFVGYRDFYTIGYPLGKFEVHDFVGWDGMKSLQIFLNKIKPIANTDGCEDVAGGLLHVLDLSWKSSTRLVIHFCDHPCHGSKYHNHAAELGDHWPTADPRGEGKTIEDLMQQLCSRRINYCFAAITKYTDKMACIMQDCYTHSHNAEFKIMEWKDADTSFAPLIINSVNSSMLRSATFNRMVDSAESNLSNTTKGKGLFHSIVG